MNFKSIREFFWPILEPIDSDKKKIEKISLHNMNVNDGNIDILYNLAKEIFKNEEKRNSNIESKSIIFIGTLGVITAIISSLLNELNNASINLSILILLISVIYFVRAIWFSVKALEKRNFCTLGFNDINIKGNDITYKKKLTIKMINMLRHNSEVINTKVDDMVMAQDYFKRGIVTLFLLIFLKVLSIIIGTKIDIMIKYLIEVLNSIQISSWILLVFFSICIFNLAYMIYFCKKNKKN
ncbi:MAG: hypothetical protein ACOCV1_08610 [Bacillota bacterium]